MFSAGDILRMSEPGELFSDDIKAAKEEYDNLARFWHPDRNSNSKESNDVMTKVNILYAECLELIKAGKYKRPGIIKMIGKDEKRYEIRYRISHSFELGTMYIGNNIVFYLVDQSNADLMENAKRVLNGFRYADERMKDEISKYLPQIVSTFETKDNKFGMVIRKRRDLFLLKDILEYYDSRIPANHVAWIMSSLYNIACYLDYAKLSHNSIALNTYFISPQYHSGALLGGWWYSVPQESKMIGAPEDIYSIMPPQIKDKKRGSILTDLESIRLIGRELLGDRNGTRLTTMENAPGPMIDWLRGVASENAFIDYSKWNDVLYKSFGERKFIEMPIDENRFYLKINKSL